MNSNITLVGHPFAPIGMGEHLRAAFFALNSVSAVVKIRDVFGIRSNDKELIDEFDLSRCEVNEDGENGAIVTVCPTQL